MTQIDMLKKHFAVRPSISNVEAQMMYRIRALPRRIKDLEENHRMQFERQTRTDPTGQRYVRYTIVNN
ncbi:MAG: hypothetical protein CMK23_05435 [Porticoccaceae bacterium]|nr:hypothetical protein [Porticoccaceae bacterium]